MNKIDVPVYLAGDWQDEQTGGYFANLLGQFTGTKDAWLTAQNGGHADPLDPTVFARWVQFLSIFVAQEIPRQTARVGLVAATIDNAAFGTTAPLPPDPFVNVTTYAAGEAAVRDVPADPHPVRERRRRRSGRADAALRGRLPVVARARDHADRLVLRRERRARELPRRARAPPTPTCTTRRTSTTRRFPTANSSAPWAKLPELALEGSGGRNRGRVRDRAARPRRHGHRELERRPVAEVDRARHRPPGDDHRGAARRPGDVRAERVAASERPRARARTPPSCARRTR